MLTPQTNLYNTDAYLYDQIVVPQRFHAPALDLVSLLPIQVDSHILDIGTGTGVFASAALERIGEDGLVIGMDPSESMLEIARLNGVPFLIKGALPNLPFLDNSFDIVAAGFVLSHLKDYKKGLIAIHDVLKKEGTFGCTTWTGGQTDYNQLWSAVLKSFVNEKALKQVVEENIYWEEWFEKEANIRAALADVGFTQINIIRREYEQILPLADYLACRYSLLTGKYAQSVLNSVSWKTLREQMYESFYKLVGDEIIYKGSVYINIAKP